MNKLGIVVNSLANGGLGSARVDRLDGRVTQLPGQDSYVCKVLVVGGGDEALEMIIDVADHVIQAYVLESFSYLCELVNWLALYLWWPKYCFLCIFSFLVLVHHNKSFFLHLD